MQKGRKMTEGLKYLPYRIANNIYIANFPIYKILYFLYKRFSDRSEIKLLNSKIQRGMNIVDIGGNVGFYAILFSKLTGESGKVHVFEPDVTNFTHLKSNIRGLRNVVTNNCAVGETSETIRLYRSRDLNVDHQTYDSEENRPYTEVKCVSLDDYFRNGETVDFIKLDIQGFDYFAVKGMTETIRRSKKVKIFGEFWPYGLQKAGVNPREYLGLLRESGFKIEMPQTLNKNDYMEKVDDKSFYTNFYGEKP